MADRQRTSRRVQNENQQAAPRRNDVIHCERCGEDYATTYKRCPFCDERAGRGGAGGKRTIRNTRGGGYGGRVNPIQVVGLVVSLVLIIAALFIVITKIGPIFFGDSSSSSGSGQSSISSSVDSSGASSSQDSSGSASSGDVSTEVPPVVTVQAISLSREEFTLNPNEPYQVLAAVSPADVTEPVVWTSSNPALATVDQEGNVLNVNQGTTKESVIITASCGGMEATCIVYCKPGGTSTPSGGSVTPNSTGTISGAGNGLNVRSGPGSSYEKVASLANGSKVTILASENGWYKVDYGNGKTGYVSADYVKVSANSSGGSSSGAASSVPANSTGTISGAGSGLNVRSGPGSSYEKVASLTNGSKVTILASENGWYKVDYGNGKTGYVSSDFVKVN